MELVREFDRHLSTQNGSNSVTITGGLPGKRVDLFYDECCGLPAILQGNLLGEAPSGVPEPASVMLLGTVLMAIGTILRRGGRQGKI